MKEYIILFVVVIALVLFLIAYIYNQSKVNLLESKLRLLMEENNRSNLEHINSLKYEIVDNLGNKLNNASLNFNNKLDGNYKETNRTMEDLTKRMIRIDEAQKKIDAMSIGLNSLQNILTDKKTRGIFGEVNLKNILNNAFGENNTKLFSIQHTLSNGTIADSVIFAPEPTGLIAIDSKFPLESFNKYINEPKGSAEYKLEFAKFKKDVKKHIDDIANKYIINNETANQAIMFIPAEAIYADIYAHHTDVIEYSFKKKVWIAGPTTLLSIISILQMVVTGLERNKYASIIQEEITKLDDDFQKFSERFDKLCRSIDSVQKNTQDINITSNKIINKFKTISSVELVEKNEERLNS